MVVTRAAHQAAPLVAALAARGAGVVELPVIAIVDPRDGGASLRRAVAHLDGYDWVVFTSANAVSRFFAAEPRRESLPRVAAIGPATAAALEHAGAAVALVPERYVAEGLLEAFPAPPAGGARVLLPRAAVAREVLPEGLRAAGYIVDVVEAYRTQRPQVDPWVLEEAATADAVAFTSPSTVEGYVAVAGKRAVPPVIVCIGPVTAEAARRHGLAVSAVAAVHTASGLVDALEGALASPAPPTPPA